MDPVVESQARSFLASRDAHAPKATLVSLPVTKLATTPEFTDASQLPANAIESLREVYVWAWPLVYMSNLKQSMKLIRSPGKSGGAPVAPINSLCMLTDVVSPDFQSVPCPNRDVVYGLA